MEVGQNLFKRSSQCYICYSYTTWSKEDIIPSTINTGTVVFSQKTHKCPYQLISTVGGTDTQLSGDNLSPVSINRVSVKLINSLKIVIPTRPYTVRPKIVVELYMLFSFCN